jgi:hypothetical protein
MNRRTFIYLTGTAGAGIALGLRDTKGATPRPAWAAAGAAAGELAIPDTGWRMWPDVHAEWQQDRIYLPADVDLARLPRNAPTGGWAALKDVASREVTLPATVEQFHWGETGFRPYQNEYKFETTDDQVKNGAYYGVSWWWRSIDIPATFIGRRILLHVRGARQRAEVYLNEQLVGYSILEELPFECDLTTAARAGTNQLAIRITNPGGRLDWRDGDRLNWAGLEFQKSHGFGGLDRALTLTAHGDVRIADAWVLNTPAPRTITAHAEIENVGAAGQRGRVRFAVVDRARGRELASAEVPVTASAQAKAECSAQLSAPAAELWDLKTPRLYLLRTSWQPERAASSVPSEQRDTEFGFRWFGVDGLGKDAVFRLNGRRIRLYTSISWGYWALNGLFPTPELAEKEVKAAQAFNLNCLNFHRNLPKEEVLTLQDHAGLLRCLEPGGGMQAVARGDRPAGFAERYMVAKIVAMIRAFRSHPSVVHYIIQNEGHVDSNNPALLALFATMRAADPSRSIVGTDGFVMRSPQAWEAAYEDVVHRSEKPATLEGGAAGWWVDHSGHATDVWQDVCYRSPTDYYYQSPNRAEIVEWGEMKGPASSDDHVSVLEEIRRHGGASYDRLDHEEILAAYNAFIDRWGFRAAFPSASDLFRSIGQRTYDTWGQLMENVRISDETDMAAISGWESTAIENHSGLVDNFRDFKADPRAIGESLMVVRPVAKQRQLVLSVGERAVFDIYLLNDSGQPVSGELTFTLTGPDGKVVTRERFPAPRFERDRLSYLVHEGVTSEPLTTAGTWKSRLELAGQPDVTHERALLVVDVPSATAKPVHVALASVPDSVAAHLRALPGVVVAPFETGTRADVIVFSGEPEAKKSAVDAEGADIIQAAKTQPGLPEAVLSAIRRGTPLLALPATEGHAAGIARQLADAGAFTFDGMVGTSRASWMGAWYFVRQHPLYAGMPVNQAMGWQYQVRSNGSNGWRVDGKNVEIVAGYGRDHDRHLGAGTFTARLGSTPLVLHQILGMHPALFRRFLANAVHHLAT